MTDAEGVEDELVEELRDASGDADVPDVGDAPALALLQPEGSDVPVDAAELDALAVPATLSVSIEDAVDEADPIGVVVEEQDAAPDPDATEAVGEPVETDESVGAADSVLLADACADADEEELSLLADDVDRDAVDDALARADAEPEVLIDGRCEVLEDAVLERETWGETDFAALGESETDTVAVRDCSAVTVTAEDADVAAVPVVDTVGETDAIALAESIDAVGIELAAADADEMLSVGTGDADEVLLTAALADAIPVPDALARPDRDELGEAAPDELTLGDRDALVDAVALTDTADDREGKERVGIAEIDADAVSLLQKDGCAVFEGDPETTDDTVVAPDTEAERVGRTLADASAEVDGVKDGVAEADADGVNFADKVSVGVFEAILVALASFEGRADADEDDEATLVFEGARDALLTDVDE